MVLGVLIGRAGLSPKQEREIRKLFDVPEFTTVVHGGTVAEERIDYLAYKAGLKRRIYYPGLLAPSICGMFIRKGKREIIQAKPDPNRLLYVIGDADLVVACPSNGSIGKATEWAIERNKSVICVTSRGWTEEFNGGLDSLLKGRE